MHLNQLRKARVISFVEDDMKMLTGRSLTEMHDALDKAEHFMFTAVPETDEEIQASAEAMKQAGVWRLPYPITTFEFEGVFKPVHMRSRDGRILREYDRAARQVVIFIAMEECPDKDGIIRNMAEGGYVRWVLTRTMSNKSEWITMGAEITQDEIQRIFSALMVSLHTKGIRRERWSGDHKLLVGRKEPSNAYTRVMIRETIAAGHGTATAGDRHRVRLHLRRGHMRQQPHGKGRQYVRLQWIAPTLVGYAEEGVVEHETYKVVETTHEPRTA
jgi:hypothetical protein